MRVTFHTRMAAAGAVGGVGRGLGFAVVVAMGRGREIGVRGRLPWALPGDVAFFRGLTVHGRDGVPGWVYARGEGEGGWGGPLAAPPREGGRADPPPPPPAVHAVIMGRKTWEGLPAQHRPLRGRVNVVVSRTMAQTDANAAAAAAADAPPHGEARGGAGRVMVARSFDEALSAAETGAPSGDIFVIGGTQVYAEALQHPGLSDLFVTHVDAHFPHADAHFPELPPSLPLLPSRVSPWVHDPRTAIPYRFTHLKREPARD